MSANSNQLHVYGQGSWHDDVQITGTKLALESLEAALKKVIRMGTDASMLSFTSDGEGYEITVRLRTAEQMDKLRQPYTDEIAQGSLAGEEPWP